MGSIEGTRKRRPDEPWRFGLINPRPCPADFDEVFVQIGRQACEEHYAPCSRRVVDYWLKLRGKDRLIAARAEHVRQAREERPRRRCPADFDLAYVHLGPMGCLRRYQAGWTTLNRWLDERGAERLKAARDHHMRGYSEPKLGRCDIGRVISKAYPVGATVTRGSRSETD